MATRFIVLAAILLALAGCAQQYYQESNINSVSIGASKEQFLRSWPTAGETPGFRIRAARRTTSGSLLEVGEIPLLSNEKERYNSDRNIVRTYWFLFENGKLVQWGRPEDWREASRQYQIQYTPTLGVPR